MAKGLKKKAYHRQEAAAVNRIAMKIGAGVAIVSLLIMLISFLR